eukprot:CAMPEP_0119540930 /NCGR_PEP_ID=MMETSP1344-20130328/52659_1 /TAXON_ID=236787 /ORGANISM="Florenciella parvula, Strain CCMP2471" /LENGTH=60 /DNA_ID=CAMNT_0007584817 /DNA_START=90 /DNA_END=268 /DNA_ORIENTATION=-
MNHDGLAASSTGPIIGKQRIYKPMMLAIEHTLPSCGRLLKMLNSVVLPLPEGPINANISP